MIKFAKRLSLLRLLPNLIAVAAFTFSIGAVAERVTSHALQTTSQSFKGQIDFSAGEIAQHRTSIQTLVATTNQTTQDQIQKQAASVNRCGLGLLYGYMSPYSRLNSTGRQMYIDQNAKCSSPPAVSDVVVTSCENFTNKFLSKGFAATGQTDIYRRINTFLLANDRDGLALVFALKKLGWKVLYWNTDIATTPPLPLNRRLVGVTPNDHEYDTKIALTKHTYHGVSIDSNLVNFSPNPGSSTVKDESIIAKLRQVPYYVGISHAGFHVWSGSYGTVTESHSFYDPADARNIQVGEFDPAHASPTCRELVVDGKKQTWCYYSGVIAVPPGPWLWF